MLWRLKKQGHQQAWYGFQKPEYSITAIVYMFPVIQIVHVLPILDLIITMISLEHHANLSVLSANGFVPKF